MPRPRRLCTAFSLFLESFRSRPLASTAAILSRVFIMPERAATWRHAHDSELLGG